MRKLSKWSKECKKALIDKDMSGKELAAELNVSYEHMNLVLNGKYDSPDMKKRICKILDVPFPSDA